MYITATHSSYSGDFPKITSIKGEKHIKTGGTINICCTATGEPLKYTWWFSSVTPSTSSSTVLPNEDGPNLVITDAREKDHQGFYQCHVTNCFGQVISDFLNIKVGEFHIVCVDICIIIDLAQSFVSIAFTTGCVCTAPCIWRHGLVFC